VIPPEFDYVAPDSLDEAIQALQQGGEDAKLLAGGHSLIPLMKMRLAAPSVLIDLRKLDELRGVQPDDLGVRIGALTTHAQLQDSPELGVVAHVAGKIADQQVRNRGTIGGSLAHGDSASDLPAVLLAAEGSVVTASGYGGGREIPATELFVDFLTTALEDGEVITHVRFPELGEWGFAYEKFTRRAEDWAMVGVCALVKKDFSDVRVALTNMGPTPIRATRVESQLRGAGPDQIAEAAQAADDGTDPPSDLNASAEYKRHLARVLTRRALERAAAA
jgi:carbon-monoxide dehydrogenase medium subunit